MNVSIDWGQRIIHVAREDMTLIQSTPVEVRELNLNDFRLALKDLEDSEEGMPFPDTHRHNTEVSVAGMTLARVIEIINGFTLTFSDGQYAVNLPGANSNVGDVVNVNQVSVRTFNSAGLISSPDIEYASYENCVTVDITSPWAGTLHPVGTAQKPVNNMTDAMLIAEYRGIKSFKLLTSMNGSVDLSHFVTRGNSRAVILTMLPHTCQHGCTFELLTIIGQMCGQLCSFQDCNLINLSNVQGWLINCTLAGTITLVGANVNIVDCVSGRTVDYGRTIIDMDNLQTNLQIRRFSGGLVLKNFNAPSNRVVIDFAPGALEIDASCVAGTIVVHGEATIIDNGGPDLIRDFSAVVSPESVADQTRVELAPELALIVTGGGSGLSAEEHDALMALADARTIMGPGGVVWTYALTNALNGLPIDDVYVWVSTDLAGLNIIASGRTDQNGVVIFYLDAGPVYVWRRKSGWIFADPDIEVVS